MKYFLYIIIPALILTFVFSGCTGIDNDTIVNDLSGSTYKLSQYSNSSDDFFSVKFNEKTLEGRTICNTFSANYEIVDNKVIISNFVSTDFEEKDMSFLTLFSNSFEYKIQDKNLIVSSGNTQIQFSPLNPNEETLFYYYFNDSIFLTLDTTQLFLRTKNPIVSKSELVTLFQNFDIQINIAKCIFDYNYGNIVFTSPISKNEYKALLEGVNAMESVNYSTPCFRTSSNSGVIFEAWTNKIMLSTSLEKADLMSILDALSLPSFELEEYYGSYWLLTLTNIETGFETLYWANMLHSLTSISYASLDKIYL